VGNYKYSAPEVLLAEACAQKKLYYNELCDMWSVGIIAYILLTHEHPFDENNYTTLRED